MEHNIKENISGYVTVKKGPPACNHISYGCTQAPPFYGSSVGNVLYNINNIKADILYFIFIIVFYLMCNLD